MKSIVKKKIGFEANSGFDFAMEQRELFKKRWGIDPTLDLSL